jgi:hypothetical protein
VPSRQKLARGKKTQYRHHAEGKHRHLPSTDQYLCDRPGKPNHSSPHSFPIAQGGAVAGGGYVRAQRVAKSTSAVKKSQGDEIPSTPLFSQDQIDLLKAQGVDISHSTVVKSSAKKTAEGKLHKGTAEKLLRVSLKDKVDTHIITVVKMIDEDASKEDINKKIMKFIKKGEYDAPQLKQILKMVESRYQKKTVTAAEERAFDDVFSRREDSDLLNNLQEFNDKTTEEVKTEYDRVVAERRSREEAYKMEMIDFKDQEAYLSKLYKDKSHRKDAMRPIIKVVGDMVADLDKKRRESLIEETTQEAKNDDESQESGDDSGDDDDEDSNAGEESD